MSIDWITVLAQITNFLVLIWLLKQFLYRPILDGIDAREAEIASRVSAAESADSKAKAAEAEYRAKLVTFESEKTALLEVARKKAFEERNILQSETTVMLELERADWRKQKAEMRSAYVDDLRAAGAGAILSLTRKVLLDLADAQLEECIVNRLEKRLAYMGEDLLAASGTEKKAVAVTGLPLAKPSRTRLAKRFRDTVANVPLTFETDVNQSPGITLRLGGARVGWTIDTYLEGLETALTERLAAQSSKRREER